MAIELGKRIRGDVIKYFVEKGFGFIRVHDKTIQDDAFIHFSEIHKEIDGFKKLIPGDLVEFDLHRGHRTLVASNLKIIKEDIDAQPNGI